MKNHNKPKLKNNILKLSLLVVAFAAVVTAFYFGYEKTIPISETNTPIERTPAEALDDQLSHNLESIDTLLSVNEMKETPFYSKYQTQLENLKESVESDKNKMSLNPESLANETFERINQRSVEAKKEIRKIKESLKNDYIANQEQVENKIDALLARADKNSEKIENRVSSELLELEMQLDETTKALKQKRDKLKEASKEKLNEIETDIEVIEKELKQTVEKIETQLEQDNA